MLVGILKFICLFSALTVGAIEGLRAWSSKEVYTIMVILFTLSVSGFIYLQWLL